MKRLILLACVAMFICSCCENKIKKEHKIVEKMTTSNRNGDHIYYYLLFDNGVEEYVEPQDYAKANVGDVWLFTECLND